MPVRSWLLRPLCAVFVVFASAIARACVCVCVCCCACACAHVCVCAFVCACARVSARQCAGKLLRVCGSSRINHLLRTTPPHTVRKAAEVFDKALLAAYVALTHLDPPTSAEQCALPLGHGGRGLRLQASVAPAAWCGSWAQCVVGVHLRTGIQSLADLATSPLPLAQKCRDAAASLPAPRTPSMGCCGTSSPSLAGPKSRDLCEAPRQKVLQGFA